MSQPSGSVNFSPAILASLSGHCVLACGDKPLYPQLEGGFLGFPSSCGCAKPLLPVLGLSVFPWRGKQSLSRSNLGMSPETAQLDCICPGRAETLSIFARPFKPLSERSPWEQHPATSYCSESNSKLRQGLCHLLSPGLALAIMVFWARAYLSGTSPPP